MGIVDSIFHLVIGFVTGTVGIHFGAIYAGVGSSPEVAAVTALAGAVVWAVVGFFMGWIPLIGSLGTFVVWLLMITQMYNVGIGSAFEIAVFAWVASFIVTHVESFFGFRSKAMGVPGA